MQMHPGEKYFTCEVCGSAFSVGSTLRRHMLTHTGKKPFSYTYVDQHSHDMIIRKNTCEHTLERNHFLIKSVDLQFQSGLN